LLQKSLFADGYANAHHSRFKLVSREWQLITCHKKTITSAFTVRLVPLHPIDSAIICLVCLVCNIFYRIKTAECVDVFHRTDEKFDQTINVEPKVKLPGVTILVSDFSERFQ
jgi:hypothetical protein